MSTKKHGKKSAERPNDIEMEADVGTSNRPLENLVHLTSLNPYITCPLCKGYLVEATTVIDCLHTFCKSCLLKYFEDNSDCPKCHYQIHQSHPSHYVAFDRTMQDIVYKLVPGIQTEEQIRREQFKKLQQTKEEREFNGQSEFTVLNMDDGLNITDSLISNRSCISSDENVAESGISVECCSAEQDPVLAHRRKDEPVLIKLIPDSTLEPIDRSFIRISVFATVNTVKRLLAYLLLNDITRYNDFDIFCNRELMGRDFSMAFVLKTRWRSKAEPLELTYREHCDF